MKTLFTLFALTLSMHSYAISTVRADLSLVLTDKTSKLCSLKSKGSTYDYRSEARWQGYTLRDLKYLEKHLVCENGQKLGEH